MRNIWNEIVDGTKDFIHRAGFKKVLLGLSGGIDSSVVACIAAAAVGQENVLGVMMPSPFSSADSISDATLLADNWSLETMVIPIDSLMKSFDAALADAFVGLNRDATEENIQARIRGVLLMALSNKFQRLLLNTCNKSEDYVGYCTLYGDSCGAVAPIGDLYKTEVYKLANWINTNEELPNIPETVLKKAPSAELKEGQKDTDDLPEYELLDPILKLHVDQNLDEEQIIQKGYESVLVKKIVGLVAGSSFKRDQSPPIIKITGVAVEDLES